MGRKHVESLASHSIVHNKACTSGKPEGVRSKSFFTTQTLPNDRRNSLCGSRGGEMEDEFIHKRSARKGKENGTMVKVQIV